MTTDSAPVLKDEAVRQFTIAVQAGTPPADLTIVAFHDLIREPRPHLDTRPIFTIVRVEDAPAQLAAPFPDGEQADVREQARDILARWRATGHAACVVALRTGRGPKLFDSPLVLQHAGNA